VSLSLTANSMVERCRNDDLMPNVPISCLPPSRMDPEVQGLKVIIDCPQPGSSRRPYITDLLHSAGGLSVAAMTLWWSSSGAVRARCPKEKKEGGKTCDLLKTKQNWKWFSKSARCWKTGRKIDGM